MSLASVDLAVTPILAELVTKQATAFAKNGKYAQLFASHAVTPTIALPPKAKELMIRDEDIFPTLPETMDFAFRVNETQHPDGKKNWVLWVWTEDGGQLYVKAWPTKAEIHHLQNWTPTTTGPE